jgi:glycosyltransferase involved in cell wall biosynthesis
MIKFSLIIVCYNKKYYLKKLLKNSKTFIKNKKNIEIIFLDNGSTDGSHEIFKNYKKRKIKKLRFLKIIKNIGYGHGIIYALKKSNNNIIGWTHADDTQIFKKMKRIYKLDLLDKKNVFIKGYRNEGRTSIEKFFSFGLSVVSLILLKKKMFEITAQPTFFSKDLRNKFINPPLDFSLDLYIFFLVKKMKYFIYRIKYNEIQNLNNFSSWNIGFLSRVRLSFIYLRYILYLSIRGHKLL